VEVDMNVFLKIIIWEAILATFAITVLGLKNFLPSDNPFFPQYWVIWFLWGILAVSIPFVIKSLRLNKSEY